VRVSLEGLDAAGKVGYRVYGSFAAHLHLSSTSLGKLLEQHGFERRLTLLQSTDGRGCRTMSEDANGFRFGQFEVDCRTGELRKQGLRLRLRGRPIDILLALLSHPGELVTREVLRARLWPADTYVDFDHGLHSAMNRLREALGDSAENPRFIETLPRKGYRFIAPVTAIESRISAPAPAPAPEATPPEPAGTNPIAIRADFETLPRAAPVPVRPRSYARWMSVGVAAVVLLGIAGVAWNLGWIPRRDAGPMRIAVVPFENLSGDPEQEFFSDGFTEEMIAELGMSRPDRLSVIGRTTSMLYKGAHKSIGEIGKELGVDYLLEGSVRRAGSRLRITAQLVNTQTMAHLWSDSFDRDVGDVLSVQREVARKIAASLELALSPGTSGPAGNAAPSFAAYELYMRGRFFREQATEEGARRAIDYYERAIAIDPGYAAAHAAIADAYRLLGAPGWEVEMPSALLTKAKAAAERALELDPESPQARAALAMVKLNYDWDVAGAEQEIKDALRLNPSFAQAHQYYSSILTCLGKPDEAIAAAARAVQLDPLAATATTSLGVRYYYGRKADEARDQFLKTLEVSPGFSVAHWGLAQVHRLKGQFNEQIDQLRTAVQLSGNSAYMRAHLGYGYAVAGDRQHAQALFDELAAEAPTQYVAPYHLALIAVGLGDEDTAMRWLERAFQDRSGWLVFLPVEPEFDGMRDRADFQQLLARVTPQNSGD
jgi:TolB-like protein/DNA-binding winged helix-turn-helix (wHTH) protein/tetratricopeptide (TPR) repeat protein